MTIMLTMIPHHTKFGYKGRDGSEDTMRTKPRHTDTAIPIYLPPLSYQGLTQTSFGAHGHHGPPPPPKKHTTHRV